MVDVCSERVTREIIRHRGDGFLVTLVRPDKIPKCWMRNSSATKITLYTTSRLFHPACSSSSGSNSDRNCTLTHQTLEKGYPIDWWRMEKELTSLPSASWKIHSKNFKSFVSTTGSNSISVDNVCKPILCYITSTRSRVIWTMCPSMSLNYLPSVRWTKYS